MLGVKNFATKLFLVAETFAAFKKPQNSSKLFTYTVHCIVIAKIDTDYSIKTL